MHSEGGKATEDGMPVRRDNIVNSFFDFIRESLDSKEN